METFPMILLPENLKSSICLHSHLFFLLMSMYKKYICVWINKGCWYVIHAHAMTVLMTGGLQLIGFLFNRLHTHTHTHRKKAGDNS